MRHRANNDNCRFDGVHCGTHTVSNAILIGDAGTSVGVYNMQGGSLSLRLLWMGLSGGTATFDQSAGAVAMSNGFIDGNDGTSTASIAVTGGTMTGATTSYVGYGSNASMSINGGAVTLAGDLYVSGDGYDGDPAGTGTLTLSSGSLHAQDVFVGYSGNGELDQSGGTLSVDRYLAYNGPSGTVGTLDFTGGTQPVAAQQVNVRTPSADGIGVVNEGDYYTLNLSGTDTVGNNAITSWSIGWGDPYAPGDLPYPGNPASEQYQYFDGGDTDTIQATATGGTRSYPASPQHVVVNDLPAEVGSIAEQVVSVGTPLTVTIPFTDPGKYETHTAEIDWGDGVASKSDDPNNPITIVESDGVGTITATHTYTDAMICAPQVLVTDSAGSTGQGTFIVNVKPTIDISGDSTVDEYGTYTLNLSTTGEDQGLDQINQWLITWGDGSDPETVDGHETSWPHSFEPGVSAAAVTATAVDFDGNTLTAPETVNVTITPAAPAITSVTNTNADSLAVSWADESSLSTSFTILQSTDGVTFTPVGNVLPDGTGEYTYAANNLTRDQTYTFEVEASGTLANSPPSAPASETAIDGTVTATGAATIGEGGTYSLNIASAFNADESATIDHYVIDWGDGSDDTIISSPAASNTATHSFASGTDSADISVEAVTAAGGSVPSFAIHIASKHVDVIPLAPSDVTGTVIGTDEIDLAWTDNSVSAESYTILRSNDGGATYQAVGTADGSDSSYQDISVEPSQSYLYEVEAEDSANMTSGSVALNNDTALATPALAVPQLTVAVDYQNIAADLSWSFDGVDDGNNVTMEVANTTLLENFHTAPLTQTYPLIIGDHYLFRVRADYPDGSIAYSTAAAAEDDGIGEAPELSANTDYNYIADHWQIILTVEMDGSPLANQPVYILSRGTDTAGSAFIGGYGAGDPTYTDASGNIYGDIGQGQTVQFKVIADGRAGWSNIATVTEGGDSAAPPTGFTAQPILQANGTYAIQATWNGYGDGDYEVQVGDALDGSGSDLGADSYGPSTPGPQEISITLGTEVTPGTQYDVMLGAVEPENQPSDAVMNGPVEAFVHTSVTIPGNAVPASPTNLKAVYDDVTQDSVTLSWDNASDNETGFQILRSVNGGAYEPLATTPADLPTDVDDQIPFDDTGTAKLKYEVFAMDNGTPSTQPATAALEADYVSITDTTFVFDKPGKLVAVDGVLFVNHIHITGTHLEKVLWQPQLNTVTKVTTFNGAVSYPPGAQSNTFGQWEPDVIENPKGVYNPAQLGSLPVISANGTAADTTADEHELILPNAPVGAASFSLLCQVQDRFREIFERESTIHGLLGMRSNYWSFQYSNSSYLWRPGFLPAPPAGVISSVETLAPTGIQERMIFGSGEGTNNFTGFQYLPII